MANQSKYIIFENSCGLEIPVIFSPLIQHKDINLNDFNFKPVAAGFCLFMGSHYNGSPFYSCWGESVSLKLTSRGKQDSEILDRYLQYDC